MEILQVYPSEKYAMYPAVQRARQLLPFFKSHQESRDAFWKAAKKQQTWKAAAKKITIYFTLEKDEDCACFTNLLVIGDFPSWSAFFQLLEGCARFFLKKNCAFSFSDSLSEEWQLIFKKNGYEGIAKQTKTLTYHTALVLGGGGAHGAYQIGVWKALREQGIFFEVITGTSVGALNGALVLQGDFEKAADLWSRLSTSQVLSLPGRVLSDDPRERFLQETRQMAKTAIIKRGVPTDPLEKLLDEYLDTEKIKQITTPRLFTVSTRLPDLSEIVTCIQEKSPEEMADWLLASASFYPAMAYRQISQSKYIDGGYRNDLPIDIAIQQGATEAFVVNVQGLGFPKKYQRPDQFVQWDCRTLWTLGSFLVFDSQRNQLNMELGYLEAKKRLHCYQGNWYTFDDVQKAETYWRKFLEDLKTEEIELSFLDDVKFWKKMRNLYIDRVEIETCGLAMLELLAKKMYLLPNKVYKVDEMVESICQTESFDIPESVLPAIGQLSAEEWRRYLKYQHQVENVQKKVSLLADAFWKKDRATLQAQLRAQPFDTLLIVYLYYLKGERVWHKNFHMRS
ncbi:MULTISPECIES: patatin-like phospholipase family protein [unclassified Enterococcus]|uniref:patatin-like phospholipase family protein n=1 Tax=unclassified Enterococcus TaxID=2608891 RepID=UPI0013EB3FC5|nr:MULTISPECIES: patatin-like phospholipase family protein [unclassified Enterococcus]